MPTGGTVPVAAPAAGPGALPAAPTPAIRRPRRPSAGWWGRTALAALGGLALWLAFPGPALTVLAPLGPAALALAVHDRRARSGFWSGLVLGLVFLVPMLSWSGTYVGALPWLALAVAEALIVALVGAASAVTSRLPLWPLWAAALWVADEALRSRFPFGGFPWARLGLSQTSGPLTSLAAYGGVPLVGFAAALVGTLLAAAVLGLRDRRVQRGVVPLLLAGALVGAGALAWLPLAGPSLTAGGPTRTVAVVQGNVPRLGLDFNAQRRAVLDNHVQETLRLAADVRAARAAAPDLVVWPENSSDIDPYRNADAAGDIAAAARAIGAPILVGAVVQGPGRYVSNTAIVWDPVTGPGATYVKRHPVPFAEYVPARDFFRLFTDKVDLVRADFAAGSRSGVLSLGGATVGDLICFEVVDDGLVADVAHTGMLVVQTNNATFGRSDESAQQLAASRLRAVEYGRTVVVAATSGISAVVAPDGSVVRRSAQFTPAVFDEAIAQRSSTTVAARLGGVPETSLLALGVGALLVAAAAGLRRRRAARGSRR